jgi:hypothetical protein
MIPLTPARVFLFFFFAAIFLDRPVVAQIVPAPGAKLNYTQIMFEHPQKAGAPMYSLEISLYPEDSLFKKPVVRLKDSSAAIMVSNLEFGKKYIWRYAGFFIGKKPAWAGPYIFETLPDPQKGLFRARVLQNEPSSGDGNLIALDMADKIIDRNGKTVWFMPPDTAGHQGNTEPLPLINDLRVTRTGTLTFINGTNAEEQDLRGNILWRAPLPGAIADINNAPVRTYSHCFKKLANGNYMVIGDAITYVPDSVLGIGNHISTGIAGADSAKTMVGYEILKEFDGNGKLAWSWSSENYFDKDELKALVSSPPDKKVLSLIPGGHMNAFDVDEKNGFVYAGFRNVSRVIKIDKTTNQVVCAWGRGMSYRGVKNGEGFFSKQHETTLLSDGSIAVFNNNRSGKGAGPSASQVGNAGAAHLVNSLAGPRGQWQSEPSSVVVFSQPSDSGSSQVIWKFDCMLDSFDNKSFRGGSVNELKNGNLLVCMGTVNRIFEITRDKEIVWSAVIEKYRTYDSVWQPVNLFKACNISSLYPCYFTVQTNADTLKRTSGSFRFKIFNDGTEDDSYRILVTSKGGYKKEFETEVLPGHSSTRVEIAPDKPAVANDKLEIAVQSVTNPDFKRVVDVEYLR